MKTFLQNISKIIISPRRINRISFLYRLVFISAAAIIASQILKVAQISFHGYGVILSLSLYVLFAALAIAILTTSLCAYSARLSDVNLSVYWLFFNVIPYANMIIAIYLLTKKGDPGVNRYGDAPKAGFNKNI